MSLFQLAPSAIPALAEARRRRWLWFCAMVVILVVLIAALSPVYRAAKAWRARSLAANAERAMVTGKLHEAGESVQSALRLSMNEPAVLRAAARWYTRAGAREAYGHWKSLVLLPTTTADERREATQFGLATQRYELCEGQLAILLKSEPERTENLDLAAQLAMQKNDRAAASRLTDQLLGHDPIHPGARFRRAQLLFSSDDPEQKSLGAQELQALGESDAPTALAALELLATEPDLAPGHAEAAAAALAAHPAGKTEHRLAAVTVQMRLAPEKRPELLDRAIRDFTSGGPDAVATVARWLMQEGESARVQELIPLPLSLTRQDLFLIRLDAFAAQKDWSEIQRILATERPPIEPVHREVFLARAALELEQALLAESHWSKALDEASRDPSLLSFLAEYTQKIGVLPVAEKAWRQLARKPSWASRANLALVPILEAQGNTRGLRDVVRQLSRMAPEDPAPRNNAAYLDLLLGEDVPVALRTAVDLVQQHPEGIEYRTTAALGYLRTDDPVAARRQYEGLDIPWEKASAGTQAVRAAVLMASQELALARAAAAPIPQNALKPEERGLLVALQRGLPKLRSRPAAVR